jgi:ubiquitin-protein ligase
MFKKKRTEQTKLRDKHIADLIKEIPNTKTLQEHGQYEIQVHALQESFAIHITLPDEFPDKPPAIRLKNYIGKTHPFMEPDGFFTGFSSIAPSNWSVHTTLGIVIKDIIKHLERNPPKSDIDPWGKPSEAKDNKTEGIASRSSSRLSDPWNSSSSSNTFTVEQLQQRKGVSKKDQVTIPSKIPELSKLSLGEMQEYLEDDMLLRNFIQSLNIYQHSHLSRNDLQDEVLIKARTNLRKKETLDSLKSELSILNSNLLCLTSKYEELQSRMNLRMKVSD